MVKRFESEQPNLSFVHINQVASAGSNDYERGYITNGLQRTDAMVVDAELLDKSLTAPAPPEPIIITAYWDLHGGTVKASALASGKLKASSRVPTTLSLVESANNGLTDHPMDISSTSAPGAGRRTSMVGNSNFGADNQTSGVSTPTSGAGNLTTGPGNSTSGKSDPKSGVGNPTSTAGKHTSVVNNLVLGVGGPASGAGGPASGAGGPASGAGGPASGAGGPASRAGGPASGAGGPATGAGGPASGAGGPASRAGNPALGVGGLASGALSGCAAKRPRTESQPRERQKTARIVGPTSVSDPNHVKLLQENQRLAVENTNLREKNLELQEKLELLGSILRDPRKRELLHARLQMHPAIKNC